MTTPRTQTHAHIIAALAADTLTGQEIANRAGIAWMGVESALKGMRRRGEVVRLKQRVANEAYRYRRAA